MQLTKRGILILLFAAPFIAVGTWLPVMESIGGAYILLCVSLFYLDWRLAGAPNRFAVSRNHDTKLSLGAQNPILISIRNRSPRPAAFKLRDEPPDEFQIETHLLEGEIKPRKTWKGKYHVLPQRRGDYHFGDMHLRWEGPLQLVLRQARFPASAPVKVYPNLLDVRRYDLLLRRNRLQEMGLRNTRMFGEGTEFERLREYQVDDDYRRINWKASAHRFRPVTVEYQTERSQNIMIVIDSGRMMQSPVDNIAKLDHVINATLLLAYVATGKGDKVGMLAFGDKVETYVSPRQGRGQFYRMLEMLYALEAQPVEPNYGNALNYLKVKQRKRSLIVIFTDISGGLGVQSLLRHTAMLGKSSLPLVVTISDPEIHTAAQQRPVDSLSAFQRSAAVQLLEERKLTHSSLRLNGILTLDVPANQISPAVINQYLELKGKTLL